LTIADIKHNFTNLKKFQFKQKEKFMVSKAQKIRLGIFIFVSTTILLATLVALSLNRFFKKNDIYKIAYTNVSVTGLDVGSSVKYLGINVGTVKSIKIDPEDIRKIIVEIGIKAGTPIKKDLRANIATLGITGIKIIELRGGTNEAELLKPEGFISAGTSLTEDFTGRAEVIAARTEELLNNLLELTNPQNRVAFNSILAETNMAMSIVNELIKNNRSQLERSLANLDTITSELSAASVSSRMITNEIASVVRSDSFKNAINNVMKITAKINKTKIYSLIDKTDEVIGRSNQILRQAENILLENRSKVSQVALDIQESVQYIKNAARQIDEDPSILIGGSNPENPPDDDIED
jgi:phospholipid/cholesterol/gamma-HCH transport system substrate-binding protein